MKVAEFSVEEFESLVRRSVRDAMREFDPDEGLTLRDDFADELSRRLSSDEDLIELDGVRSRFGND